MKTIEIQQTDQKKNKRLVKQLFKLNTFSRHFSFFYEPKLIVRTEEPAVFFIKDYLINKQIKYKVYPYPFTKKGYGEAKKSVVIKYKDYFRYLFDSNSQLALHRDKRDDYKILERNNHTLLNSFGYEWADESLFYLQLAWGRVGVIKKHETKSLGEVLVCKLVMILLRFSYKLTKLLK